LYKPTLVAGDRKFGKPCRREQPAGTGVQENIREETGRRWGLLDREPTLLQDRIPGAVALALEPCLQGGSSQTAGRQSGDSFEQFASRGTNSLVEVGRGVQAFFNDRKCLGGYSLHEGSPGF
jgi:hypothetical protein